MCTKIVETATLAEFDILRDTRQDIRELKWAQPAYREATNLYFRIKQAKVEIVRLNVEIRRMLTFMVDDHIDYFRAIAATLLTDPPLARELSSRWIYNQRVNQEIASILVRTSKLAGFTGTLIPGTRLGRADLDPDGHCHIPLPRWARDILGLSYTFVESADADEHGTNSLEGEMDGEEDGIGGQGDEQAEQADSLVHFMDDLGIDSTM